jgi:thiol-disulfide isomerase/thioredoxin
MLDVHEQLRGYGEQLDSLMTRVEIDEVLAERAAVVEPMGTSRLRGPNRRRPGWAVALVAIAAVLILVGSVAVMSSLFGEPRVTDEPDPVTTTVVSEDGSFLGVPLQPTRSFRATVRLAQVAGSGDPSPDDPEVIVSYGGPAVGLRVDVVSNDSPPGSIEPGSFLVFEGTRAGTYLADRHLFVRFPADEATELGGLGEWGWNLWAQRCQSGDVERVSEEMLAGRVTTHVSCSSLRGALDVWVDTETGVVMKSTAPVSALVGPISSELAIWRGNVEVIDIDYEPAFRESDFSVEAPLGAETGELASDARAYLVQDDMTFHEAKEAAATNPTSARFDGPAPPLSGPLLTGGTFDLEDLQGTNVVLLWWASWCPPSLDALEATNQIAAERVDVAFVGVSFQDSAVDAQRVLTLGDITIPSLDTEGSADVARQWNIEGCPAIALVDAEGFYLENHQGITTHDEIATLLDNANW